MIYFKTKINNQEYTENGEGVKSTVLQLFGSVN